MYGLVFATVCFLATHVAFIEQNGGQKNQSMSKGLPTGFDKMTDTFMGEMEKYIKDLNTFTWRLTDMTSNDSDTGLQERKRRQSNMSDFSYGNSLGQVHGGSDFERQPDFSKHFENLSSANDNNPSGTPFDSSKMFKHMKLSLEDIAKTAIWNDYFGTMGYNNTKHPIYLPDILKYTEPAVGFNQSTNQYDIINLLHSLKLSHQKAGQQALCKVTNRLVDWMSNYSKIILDLRGKLDESGRFPTGGLQGVNDKIHRSLLDQINNISDTVGELEKKVAAVIQDLESEQTSLNDSPLVFIATSPGGSCYFFSKHKATFYDAVDTCKREQDAFLVIIESEQENAFIKKTLYENKAEHNYFIGAKRRDDVFIWERTRIQIDFTNWIEWERDLDNNRRHSCIELKYYGSSIGYRWKDTPCFVKKNYICEKYLRK